MLFFFGLSLIYLLFGICFYQFILNVFMIFLCLM